MKKTGISIFSVIIFALIILYWLGLIDNPGAILMAPVIWFSQLLTNLLN